MAADHGVGTDRAGGTVLTEDSRVFRWWDYPIFILLSVASLGAILWLLRTWLGLDWAGDPVQLVLLTGLLGGVLANQQGRWFLLLPMRRPRPLAPEAGLEVAVVTTFVPGAEPAAMLERFLDALAALDYPHDSWLLDEGKDEATREACARRGISYFTRVGRPCYQTESGPFKARSKHGNYNAWLHEVGFRHYDVLVAFDPDHVPSAAHLSSILGYFRDSGVGYVQSAQAFYNQRASFIARGAAEETYAYYSAVQMASYGMEYPIIVGSHNCHWMEALEAVGGFADHDADDLLLTLRYRSAGWKGVYVPRILARGLTPVDWRGYLIQQRRWARSVADIKLRRWRMYSGDLSARSRAMSFLHGISFLHRSLVLAAGLAILLYVVATGDAPAVFSPALIEPALCVLATLSAQEVYRQRFFLDGHERGVRWRPALLELAKWPWFIAALLDVLLDRKVGYALTRKAGRSRRYVAFVVTHVAVAAVLGAGLLLGHVLHGGWGGPEAVAVAWLAGSLLLAASGLLSFPPPYDASMPVWDDAEGER